MTSRTHPTITTLEIYTDEGQVAGENARLPSGSTRYQQVERSIHLGMRILETHDGKASLVKTATDIVRGNQANKKTTLYKGDFHDMPKWIEFFLKTMRSDFPMVYLSHMEGEARAVRQANEIKALKDFSPKHIGYMDVNRYIVNNMIAASQRNDAANLARFQFEMAISIAHEVVHFLTGFLAGEKADTLSTPPDTSVDGYGSKRLGEAGRYWEATLLGGQAQTWQNPKDPAGVLQAGTLYLMDDGMAKSRARLINMAYVNAFVSGSRSFSFTR